MSRPPEDQYRWSSHTMTEHIPQPRKAEAASALESPSDEKSVRHLAAYDTGQGEKYDRIPAGALLSVPGPVAPDVAGQTVERDTESIYDVNPGTKGWLCLAGVVTVNALVYGMMNVFGVFQSYYLRENLSSQTATAVSWIGSVQQSLAPLLGCFAGPMFDSGHLKPLIVFGGSIYVFSFMMASIAKPQHYYQYFLSHGLGVGIGMGCIFSPSVSCIPHHFARSRYRTLAFGVQACGSSVGGILFTVMARYLLPAVGYGWTMRIFGFIALIILVFAFFTLSTTQPPRKRLAILSPVVFRSVPYCFCVMGCCIGNLSIYTPLTFGVTYATSKGLSEAVGNDILAVSNAASIIGRLFPLMAAGVPGPLNLMVIGSFLSSVMQFLWTRTHNAAGIWTFFPLYSVACGPYGAALNAATATLAEAPDQVGLYLGMAFFTEAWFWLAGTPITAALIKNGTDYLPSSMFGGTTLLVSCALLSVCRHLVAKRRGTPWL